MRYAFEQRKRAVELYIECGKSVSAVRGKLGYPSRQIQIHDCVPRDGAPLSPPSYRSKWDAPSTTRRHSMARVPWRCQKRGTTGKTRGIIELGN